MNPLDLRGPEFLAAYAQLLGLAVLAAFALRRLLRPPGGEPDAHHLALDAIETAILAGGPARGFDAAAARLVSDRAVSIEGRSWLLRNTGKLPASATRVERALHGAARAAATPHELRGQVAAELDEVRAKLVALGLVLDAPAARAVAKASALPFWACFGLGVAKVVVGVSRGRPVGILLALLLLTAVFALVFRFRPPLRTRLGDRALARLRARHANLRAPRAGAGARGAADLALAVGLFGGAALVANALPELRSALRYNPAYSASPSSGDGSGSSCGSSSSCGGGGGGCGGCGGGGGD